MANATTHSTPLAEEIAKFNALAANWWDPNGPMAPLHWMNPARLGFITGHLPAQKLNGLDIGCGAGLLTEPLARLGHKMLGVDGAAEAIGVAQRRAQDEAKTGKLPATYKVGSTADLKGQKFDFITALEIIEHVDSPQAFLAEISALLKPGGLLFLSTMNRTFKSRLLAIGLAEYVLRALPIGTHDWQKFIKPSELAAMLENAGCELLDAQGLVMNPLQKTFRLSPHDLDVNYILVARRKK